MKHEKLEVIDEGNDACIDIDNIFLHKTETYVSHAPLNMKWKL